MATSTAQPLPQSVRGQKVVSEQASVEDRRWLDNVMHISTATPVRPPKSRPWDLTLYEDDKLKLSFGQVPGATIVIDDVLTGDLVKRVGLLLERLRETPFEVGVLVLSPYRNDFTAADRNALRLKQVVVVEPVPNGENHSPRYRAEEFIGEFKRRSELQAANLEAYLKGE